MGSDAPGQLDRSDQGTALIQVVYNADNPVSTIIPLIKDEIRRDAVPEILAKRELERQLDRDSVQASQILYAVRGKKGSLIALTAVTTKSVEVISYSSHSMQSATEDFNWFNEITKGLVNAEGEYGRFEIDPEIPGRRKYRQPIVMSLGVAWLVQFFNHYPEVFAGQQTSLYIMLGLSIAVGLAYVFTL